MAFWPISMTAWRSCMTCSFDSGVAWQRLIRKSLRSWSRVISLLSSTWISPWIFRCVHARPARRGRRRWRGRGPRPRTAWSHRRWPRRGSRAAGSASSSRAVSITTGVSIVARSLRSRRQTSKPLMSGSIRSSRTTSGRCSRASCRPGSPVSATIGSKSRSRSEPGDQSPPGPGGLRRSGPCPSSRSPRPGREPVRTGRPSTGRPLRRAARRRRRRAARGRA